MPTSYNTISVNTIQSNTSSERSSSSRKWPSGGIHTIGKGLSKSL